MQSQQKPSILWICDGMRIGRAENRIMVRGLMGVYCRKSTVEGFGRLESPTDILLIISFHDEPHFFSILVCKKGRKSCIFRAVTFDFCILTSATLIHFSSSRALCWLRSFVGQRQDAKTALASLLNWRTVARTDQQTPSLPFLSLWDHSEPRQWYGTRRTNSSW